MNETPDTKSNLTRFNTAVGNGMELRFEKNKREVASKYRFWHIGDYWEPNEIIFFFNLVSPTKKQKIYICIWDVTNTLGLFSTD